VSDLDVIRRLQSAAESIPVEHPTATAAISGGRRRSLLRVVSVAAVVVVIGAGTGWAITQLGSLHRAPRTSGTPATFDPGRARSFLTPYGSRIALPEGWYQRGIQVPGLELLDLTTNRAALDAAIQGCGGSDSGCSTRNLEPGDVGPDGAFVQVGVFREPCDGCTPTPPPAHLEPADFQAEGSGGPGAAMRYTTWVDDGTQVQVRYWMGPDATDANRRATEFLLGNLELPQPQFNQADVHPFDVPYSGEDVPMPNGWTALSETSYQSGYLLGLIASPDRAVVRQVKPCRVGSNHYWCGTFGFDANLAKPTDTMVRVDGEFLCLAERCAGDPLPDHVSPRDFPKVGVEAGGEMYELTGTAGGGVFHISYWIGPQASEATREATLYLVSNLHLPGPGSAELEQKYTDPEHRFTVEYPSDWVRAEESQTPRLSSPVEIFAAGTYDLRPGGDSCAQFPVNAMEDLGPADALVWIAEAAPGSHFPPRPERFDAEPPNPQMEARYCLQDPDKPYTQWWIPFTQGNRNFYVLVAMGDEISDARRAEAWNVVESFTPETAPAIGPTAGSVDGDGG
jgi:hypothetical protein